jgi:DNA-binding CsgD family transcriptional regulator
MTAVAEMVKFDRGEREVAALVRSGCDPKLIAADLEISVPTVYRRISDMCSRVHVLDRYELLIWVLQHPASLDRDGMGLAGLHRQPCDCGSPYCAAGCLSARRA